MSPSRTARLMNVSINDDATKSIEVILDACCAAIAEGLEERKVEKVDSEATENDEENAEKKPARRRTTRARAAKAEEAAE